MNSAYVLNTAPASAAVSVAELKLHLRIPVTDTSEDTPLAAIIEAATAIGEGYTRRDFVSRTWEVYLDGFGDRFEIRRAPVSSIVSIEVLINGVWVAQASSGYYLKKSPGFQEVVLRPGVVLAIGDLQEQNTRITFISGYSTVPDGIKQGLMVHATHMYTERGDTDNFAVFQSQSLGAMRVPPEVKALYHPYIIFSVG